MDKDNLNMLFIQTLDCIDTIISNKFYNDKDTIKEIKKIINNWYKRFQETNDLKGIETEELEYLDTEITELFDKYISSESVKENYTERLSYNFGLLEKEWQSQMLGESNE